MRLSKKKFLSGTPPFRVGDSRFHAPSTHPKGWGIIFHFFNSPEHEVVPESVIPFGGDTPDHIRAVN